MLFSAARGSHRPREGQTESLHTAPLVTGPPNGEEKRAEHCRGDSSPCFVMVSPFLSSLVETVSVAQAGSKLSIFLHQPPEYWGYRCVSPSDFTPTIDALTWPRLCLARIQFFLQGATLLLEIEWKALSPIFKGNKQFGTLWGQLFSYVSERR